MQDLVTRFVKGHRLFVLVTIVILVSCCLVGIAMMMYYRSDAYRIDLSRPEFKESREKILSEEKQDNDFPATGELTDEVLDDFMKRYDSLSERIIDSKAFSNDVLSDQQLGLTQK